MTTNTSGSGGNDGKKTISPFALTANDNPGNLITHTQLKGPNYEEWVKAMRTSLRAKKKKGFIDGTIKEPDENSDEKEDWWTVNSMIISWIFNTIEPSLRSTISYRETAKELWDDIQQQFSVRNGARVHQLRTEVSNCKQNGDTVMGYYGRIKKIWDDLVDYDQMPLCTCNGCKCNLNARLEKRSEEERVHQFLMGLDETPYSTVCSNIIATDPLPNMYRVYSQVTEQEQVKAMTRSTPERSAPMSFAVKTAGVRNPGGDRKDDATVVLTVRNQATPLKHAIGCIAIQNGGVVASKAVAGDVVVNKVAEGEEERELMPLKRQEPPLLYPHLEMLTRPG